MEPWLVVITNRVVKVRLRKKSMKVHHRNGFRAIPHDERMAYPAIAALLDTPAKNSLQMSLEVGERPASPVTLILASLTISGFGLHHRSGFPANSPTITRGRIRFGMIVIGRAGV